MSRQELPSKRGHVTQKAKIGGVRTLYLSTDAAPPGQPLEIFLRVKGKASAEVVTLYDVIARLISLALQEGVPVASIGELLHESKCAPAGPVQEDDRIKNCHGTIDYIGRYLLVYFAGRDDLAHVPVDAYEERETNP